MSKIETKQIDRIEIINGAHIQVREATIITKDDVEIAKNYHRWSCAPGDDISAMPQEVKDIANVVWTEEVINKYQQSIQENAF